MTDAAQQRSQPIPAWLIRTIWTLHRALLRFSAGRLGLRRPTDTTWGMLRLETVGRRSGRVRRAIVGYIEDGPNIVTPAMNGWLEPDPAWWLNLQAQPEATVLLPDGPRAVRARAAVGEERDRLWRRYVDLGTSAFNDKSAAYRSHETAIVVLEPRSA